MNIPNWDYQNFPGDDNEVMREIVRVNSENITSTNLVLPDVIPAIPTIYNLDGTIDYIELENMLKKQSEAWIKTVLIAWTTWESSLLEHNEQIEYVKKAVIISKNYWLNVLAWSGSNTTNEQNKLTSWIFESWAQASLLLPPYYIKASNTDIVRHLTEWLNIWPAIIYSISWRTGVPLSIEVLEILSKHPNFLWVKECDWSEKISKLVEKWIKVWTWNDDSSIKDIHEKWATWTISVICNIDPELILEIQKWTNITSKKVNRLMNLSHLIFLPWQPNPKPIHNAIEMIRRSVNENINFPATFRLPVWPLNNKQQEYLAQGLKNLWINSTPFYDNFHLIK